MISFSVMSFTFSVDPSQHYNLVNCKMAAGSSARFSLIGAHYAHCVYAALIRGKQQDQQQQVAKQFPRQFIKGNALVAPAPAPALGSYLGKLLPKTRDSLALGSAA